MERRGKVGSSVSRAARRERRAERQAWDRGVDSDWGAEFRTRVSGWANEAEHEAVVCVRKSAWESVTEREELVGRLRVASRFPQYLMCGQICSRKGGHGGVEGWECYLITAMFTGAVVLAR